MTDNNNDIKPKNGKTSKNEVLGFIWQVFFKILIVVLVLAILAVFALASVCKTVADILEKEPSIQNNGDAYNLRAAEICKENNIPYYPGCVTPTEIMAALELGITTVKFFPANVYGGLKALKALSAPFPQVKFIPTGGVDRSNIDEFLAFDKIAAIGGSFFVKESLDKLEAGK